MVQELVPGGDETLYTLGSYLDATGRPLGLFSGRKLRQTPPLVGTCRVGEAVWVQEMVDAGLRFLAALGFRGALPGRVQARPPGRPLQAHGDQPAPLPVARPRRRVRRRPPADGLLRPARAPRPGRVDERAAETLGDHVPRRRGPGVPAPALRRRRARPATTSAPPPCTPPASSGASSADPREPTSAAPAGCSTRSAAVSSGSATTSRTTRRPGSGSSAGSDRRATSSRRPSSTSRGSRSSVRAGTSTAGSRVRVVLPRPARPAARAPSPPARGRASSLARRALRGRADPRRRRPVALDAARGARLGGAP